MLTMRGNWRDTRAEIINEATGEVVARIHRESSNASEPLLGRQTYKLTVAGGVDKAVLATMCICLDEMQEADSVKEARCGGLCTIM